MEIAIFIFFCLNFCFERTEWQYALCTTGVKVWQRRNSFRAQDALSVGWRRPTCCQLAVATTPFDKSSRSDWEFLMTNYNCFQSPTIPPSQALVKVPSHQAALWLGQKRECHLCRVAGNTVWSHIVLKFRCGEASYKLLFFVLYFSYFTRTVESHIPPSQGLLKFTLRSAWSKVIFQGQRSQGHKCQGHSIMVSANGSLQFGGRSNLEVR